MSNPFLQLADQQMVAATKAKHRRREVKILKSEAEAPMKLSDAEQAQADQSTQMRAYHRWKREEIKTHLEPHEGWLELSRLLRAMTIEDAQPLVDFVRDDAWLRNADLRTRQVALSAIANAIIRLRVRNGYAPMEDSMLGAEPTVFEIIREQLRVLA